MIMIFYARKARRMNVICITSTALSYFAFVLAPMNDGKNKFRPNLTLRRLPVEGWFPFDEKQSPVFEIIYTTQWVQTFFLISVILAIDSFLCVVVLHACGQFAVLSKRIKNYTGIVKHEKVNNNNGECACLSCIVKNHVSLIEYVKIIEDSFNELILFQLLGDSVLLSVEGYLLVVAEDIRNTAYNLEWYRYTSCSASPLVLLIRSGFSCKITAGRFSVMRLSYYKKIITTSISYISVLKAIK
ncbi:hypothetical protein KPH14_008904 [Odynerus spinipes]|uniref:Uncharacterized protein n=1 Tax=Odynerus spinipes TaxID=1348599 RepID=A0AAD9RN47_9HYME|nr:hypothetical protein KPH14_008904 [Odynerus spinipes]